MIVIEITAPIDRALSFDTGDRIMVSRLTPALENLLSSVKLDGQHVARLVVSEDEEIADASDGSEVATASRRRRTRPAVMDAP